MVLVVLVRAISGANSCLWCSHYAGDGGNIPEAGTHVGGNANQPVIYKCADAHDFFGRHFNQFVGVLLPELALCRPDSPSMCEDEF